MPKFHHSLDMMAADYVAAAINAVFLIYVGNDVGKHYIHNARVAYSIVKDPSTCTMIQPS